MHHAWVVLGCKSLPIGAWRQSSSLASPPQAGIRHTLIDMCWCLVHLTLNNQLTTHSVEHSGYISPLPCCYYYLSTSWLHSHSLWLWQALLCLLESASVSTLLPHFQTVTSALTPPCWLHWCVLDSQQLSTVLSHCIYPGLMTILPFSLLFL